MGKVQKINQKVNLFAHEESFGVPRGWNPITVYK